MAEDIFRENNNQQPKPMGEKDGTPMKRLVLRDLPFRQSSNALCIRHLQTGNFKFFHWYIEDWFHVFLRLPTVVSLGGFVVVWTSFILLFAGIYAAADNANNEIDCGLGNVGEDFSWPAAFAFSLETCTTVGYGLPGNNNAFFQNCPGVQVTIYFQMLISMLFNAFLLAFMFARFARCETRGAQVLFSDKATVNREVLGNGTVRYMLSARLYDADSSYPLVEAHVRFYAVKHKSMHEELPAGAPPVYHDMNMEPMRVSVPNDDLGAVLLTSVPTTVSHHIDFYSPILPPTKKLRGPEDGRVRPDSGFVLDPCGLSLRENDAYTGNRDGLRCVVCGETYASTANLVQHIRYNQHTESHDDVPVKGSHQELDVDAIFKDRSLPDNETDQDAASDSSEGGLEDKGGHAKIDVAPPTPWFDEFRRHFAESNVEIICVLEAIDPIMSGTFQAIQSYTIDDLVFGGDFAPCLLPDFKGGGGIKDRMGCSAGGMRYRSVLFGRHRRAVKVDLDKFHGIVDKGEQ